VVHFTASCDPPDVNQKFAESLSVDYPILSDPEKKVAGAYGVLNPERGFANRWTFYIGKDGNILYIDKEVKPQTSGADIAARLKELGVPARK
jgi:peroxiredoxin Q/BCP